jgi:hypothetical protein
MSIVDAFYGMSELQEPRPVKLIIGLIYSQNAKVDECIEKLRASFGDSDFISNRLPFQFTSYYEEEMGKDLSRKIISFRRLIKRDELADIKVFTTKLERIFSIAGKRTINIDPGYIAHEHLILATGKGYYHRPYLGKGVYADLTLVFKNKEFQTLEWTYPDYRGEELRKLFKELRESYTLQLAKELGK